MIYADNAGVVSQSPKQLRKITVAIVVVCAAFGLTESEAKTETMCLRTKGMPEPIAMFNIEADGKTKLNASEPPELSPSGGMPKDLGVNSGCRDKSS